MYLRQVGAVPVLSCMENIELWCEPVQRLGGGGGCNIFVPVLGENGSKVSPTGDIFDQPPGQIR